MERPRPRAKHRSAKKRESVPSHISTKKDMSRPRPSLKLMKHRISSSHPTKKSIRLIQSKSPESKDEPPVVLMKMTDLNISTSPKYKNNSPKRNKVKNDDILFTKLSKIKQHQKTRKSDLGKDFDEIKQFISNTAASIKSESINMNNSPKNTINNKNDNELPTSLKLIGMRNPSSLLYHRQFDQQYVDKIHHHRAQSSIVSVNTNNVNITPKIHTNNVFNVTVNDKYKHLRSYSSIMGTKNNAKVNVNGKVNVNVKVNVNRNGNGMHDRNDNVTYVQNAKNRKPSELFSNSNIGIDNRKNKMGKDMNNTLMKRTKSKKEILQELADEYESESDEEANQDDDLKRDK